MKFVLKKNVWSIQVLVDREGPGFAWKDPGMSWKSPWISHPVNSGNPDKYSQTAKEFPYKLNTNNHDNINSIKIRLKGKKASYIAINPSYTEWLLYLWFL